MISQYIHIANHYGVYLKLIQCYIVNYISIKNEKKVGSADGQTDFSRERAVSLSIELPICREMRGEYLRMVLKTYIQR